MPIAANTAYLAASADVVAKDVTLGTDLSDPAADGLLVGLSTALTSTNLAYKQNLVGLLEKLKDRVLSELSVRSAAAIDASIALDGAIAFTTANVLRLRIGANVAAAQASHDIDKMFELCINRLLEDAKTGP